MLPNTIRCWRKALFHLIGRKLKPAGLALLVALVIASGCARRAENITAECAGRRVGPYDVNGGHLAYVWSPAQLVSTQGHLVLRDLITGGETELEPDLSGPMAVCDGRVVWWNARLRDDEGKSDITAYDIDKREKSTVAHAKVQNLDADGDCVVWEEPKEAGGSDIVLYDFTSGKQRIISPTDTEKAMVNRAPCIGGGCIAWEAHDRETGKSTIATYDIATGRLSTIDVSQVRPRMSVSGNYLVYCSGRGEIHLYDIAGKFDRVVASLDRLKGSPCVDGDRIVWCEHIRKEEFKGIPGQPLMDHKDIVDVFLYDINSGKKKAVAEYLLSNGRVAVDGGRVYLTVYREYPAPGASNMVVPVDLWAW